MTSHTLPISYSQSIELWGSDIPINMYIFGKYLSCDLFAFQIYRVTRKATPILSCIPVSLNYFTGIKVLILKFGAL